MRRTAPTETPRIVPRPAPQPAPRLAPRLRCRHPCARQQGLSLIVALIALVALIAAGSALFRSTDAANYAAANYQFLRTAEQNTDLAMNEALLAYLQSHPNAALQMADRNTDMPGAAYFAVQQAETPEGIPQVLANLAAPTWTGAGPSPTGWPGEQVDPQSQQLRRYVVERLCTAPGPATAATCRLYEYQFQRNCQNNCSAGSTEWLPFIRVTVRIDGPRNSVAYSQMFMKGE